MEYSFLDHERIVDLATDHVKNLLMTRLIVAYEAIEYFRYPLFDGVCLDFGVVASCISCYDLL